MIGGLLRHRRWRFRELRVSSNPEDRMFVSDPRTTDIMNRRSFLLGSAGLTFSTGPIVSSLQAQEGAAEKGTERRLKETAGRKATRFLLACMTLPYHDFPLERALSGIKAAGFHYVTWGTSHKEGSGKEVPIIAPDAHPKTAKELG